MNLRDLYYVVSLAEQGHYGKAAKACHVSQPTLSGQIAKLEAELGVAIFQKRGRSVGLTEAGEEIIAHARKALTAAHDITEAARAHKDPLNGRLRLGIIPTLSPYLMPYVLPLAAEKLPGAPLALSTPGARRVLGPDLEAGQRPQLVVAKDEWQSAESLGEWTLAGCTVGPAFAFEGFELAPAGWQPL